MPSIPAPPPAATPPASPWAPFRARTVRLIWCAALISNIGTWMHDVAATWLMASLTSVPLMVALVQAATSLPVFLLALPAGALADLADRRRLLLALQIAATALTLIVAASAVTPPLLLLLTFLLGSLAALDAPAWQAITPDLAGRPLLTQVVALDGIGINIARSVGPVLGGLVITALGLTWPIVADTLSFLAVFLTLLAWRPQQRPASPLPAEHLLGAVCSGARFAGGSAPLRATLVRAAAFFSFASAFWSLLPLMARNPLAGGAALYGSLLAAVSLGAILAVLLLPWLKRRLGADGAVRVGTLLLAFAMALLALVPVLAAGLLACLLAGGACIAVLVSLNASAQLALPDGARSRGLVVTLAVLFGSMTLGSIVWGLVAGHAGPGPTLLMAAGGALLALVASRSWRLLGDTAPDLAPSGDRPTASRCW